jgi:hypothetical protein
MNIYEHSQVWESVRSVEGHYSGQNKWPATGDDENIWEHMIWSASADHPGTLSTDVLEPWIGIAVTLPFPWMSEALY